MRCLFHLGRMRACGRGLISSLPRWEANEGSAVAEALQEACFTRENYETQVDPGLVRGWGVSKQHL